MARHGPDTKGSETEKGRKGCSKEEKRTHAESGERSAATRTRGKKNYKSSSLQGTGNRFLIGSRKMRQGIGGVAAPFSGAGRPQVS
jgi:hypothetical protein